MEALLSSKEANTSAAIAREELLRADVDQARTRADALSQSLAEVTVTCEGNQYV